eukprot:CAMPEP_0175168774 /NCGR_PEP_ID=MMETSP0087-20121206/29160_1 /TAXON_ID=136419 /ORGANISM="Unknown Unknown, Strain D1" /LENGTH=43 /DNA_ID= /DNA_START= /DNA_END= /DNA_ORIENTATION=
MAKNLVYEGGAGVNTLNLLHRLNHLHAKHKLDFIFDDFDELVW